MKIRDKYTCPLEVTHDIIKGKWKPIIIWTLKNRAHSLASLEREIEGINQKMLMEHLKDLVNFGILNKKKGYGYPLKTEYTLTERGRELLDALTIMQKIGSELLNS